MIPTIIVLGAAVVSLMILLGKGYRDNEVLRGELLEMELDIQRLTRTASGGHGSCRQSGVKSL